MLKAGERQPLAIWRECRGSNANAVVLFWQYSPYGVCIEGQGSRICSTCVAPTRRVDAR